MNPQDVTGGSALGSADFRDLFDNAPCGYLLLGPDGSIAQANHTVAEWLGQPASALVGQRFQDLLSVAGKVYLQTHLSPLLRMQGFVNEVALDLLRNDQSLLPTLVNIVERIEPSNDLTITRVTIFNASDRRRYESELVAMRGAAERANTELNALNRDLELRVSDAVNERLAAEEALRQAQKMEAIGQLTGGVAHDFNNLLTVIRGSVELLRRSDLSSEKRVRYIDAIGETADRAAKLTSQLLSFARRQALNPVQFDASSSLLEVTEIVRSLIGSRIRVDVQTPEVPCIVEADRSQFDTAIVNMCINARDAMEGEGTLTIATIPVSGMPEIRLHTPVAGDFIAVSITDTGSGIEPDNLPRIFEPFFTTKGVGAGTGLGLSQVIGFAKQSGGDVRIDSEVSKGTTFTLYLPRVTPRADYTLLEAPLEQASAGEGACILVVEDNAQVGEFATAALDELGYNCVRAWNAHGALEELERNDGRFDAVFSDVVMPGMSGLELGGEIRARFPGIPIVLTSGYSHVLAQNGNHGFELLHKPYSIEQLSRVLRNAIASKETRQAQIGA